MSPEWRARSMKLLRTSNNPESEPNAAQRHRRRLTNTSLRIGPRVGGLYVVLDHVRQRRVDDLARVVRLRGRAIPETGSETVRHGGG